MSDEHSGSELITVYQAPDEITAHLVASVLKDAGVETLIRSRQVPWMDGVMVNAEGYWGDVMVPQCERTRSLQLIMDFQLAVLDDESDEPAEETT
jgi:hypothetical protein